MVLITIAVARAITLVAATATVAAATPVVTATTIATTAAAVTALGRHDLGSRVDDCRVGGIWVA